MKTNKTLIYIGILFGGILLGWFLFGGSSKPEAENDHNAMAETAQLWTCSMHPQIMQPEPGDCPICGMDLIPADTGADGLTINEIKMSKNAMALANIQTTIVGNLSVTDDNQMTLSGKIIPNEEANAVQASYFEGRIEKLHVNFTGEAVLKGQLLATIYAPTLVAAQQELLTAASMKQSQPALYNAVRNKLKLWKLSESQINQIESFGEVREQFPIYATVSGTVSQKMAEEGDYVKQGQPIVKVSNLATVWAMFDAYETQLSQLKERQKITVTTNAYPNKAFEATVSFIDPTLNTKSRTVSVRATLDNKEDLLKPGMFVSAKVDVSKGATAHETITVPASAVLWTGDRSLVYVKTNPNPPIFEMREVTLGNKNGNVYTIVEGLNNGEEVVTNGTFTVDAAAQLQGKKSMMNSEGGTTNTGHEGHTGKEQTISKTGSDIINENERLDAPKAFQQQLKMVFDTYIHLKDALVEDDSKSVSAHAKTFLNDLKKVDMTLLSDKKTHNRWMPLAKEITTLTTSISNASTIKDQRNHFKPLSSHFITAIQLFGVGEKVYVEFCPMADNNKGAYWMSKEEKIINPYFGEAMLTCGEVNQVIN